MTSSRFAIIEKLGEAGLFPAGAFLEKRRPEKAPGEECAPEPSRSACRRCGCDDDLEAAEAGSKYRDLDLGAAKDAIAFARRWRSSGRDGPISRSRYPRPSGSCATSGSSSFERRRPRSSKRGARRTGRAARSSRRPSMTV